MNHPCHVVLPAAVAPEFAQGFMKTVDQPEPVHGSWSAICSELQSEERTGHRIVGEGLLPGGRVKTLKVRVLAFAVSFLGSCGADARCFWKVKPEMRTLACLSSQLRQDVSPSAWGCP